MRETVMRCEFANYFLAEDAALLPRSPIRRPDGIPVLFPPFAHRPRVRHRTDDVRRRGEGELSQFGSAEMIIQCANAHAMCIKFRGSEEADRFFQRNRFFESIGDLDNRFAKKQG